MEASMKTEDRGLGIEDGGKDPEARCALRVARLGMWKYPRSNDQEPTPKAFGTFPRLIQCGADCVVEWGAPHPALSPLLRRAEREKTEACGAGWLFTICHRLPLGTAVFIIKIF